MFTEEGFSRDFTTTNHLQSGNRNSVTRLKWRKTCSTFQITSYWSQELISNSLAQYCYHWVFAVCFNNLTAIDDWLASLLTAPMGRQGCIVVSRDKVLMQELVRVFSHNPFSAVTAPKPDLDFLRNPLC